MCSPASQGRFGCDGFGCYSYSPVDVANVDLRRFPRVAEAKIYGVTRLRAGDLLLIPAFWAHHLVHHHLNGRGRNVALSFVRRLPGISRSQRPFVAELAETHHVLQQGAAETSAAARSLAYLDVSPFGLTGKVFVTY